MSASQPQTYIIRGGKKGRERLGTLSRILAPSTNDVLDRAGVGVGAQIIDLGCGGGDVTLELARRAGPRAMSGAMISTARFSILPGPKPRKPGRATSPSRRSILPVPGRAVPYRLFMRGSSSRM